MRTPQLVRPVARFTDQVLRGVGQVMLQNNAVTGLLFLLGIFVNDWVYGLYALLGTAIATLTAILLGAAREAVDRGLFGFNGTLTAVALAVYLRHDATLFIYVIVAAAFSSVAMAAIRKAVGPKGSALTAPFVFTTWIFIGAIVAYSRLHGVEALAPHLASHAGPAAAGISAAGALAAVLNGVAQVFFQQNVWTGVIFLVALAVNSRISCVAALLAAALAMLAAWYLGADPGSIRNGLYGFNAVLTAIAVGGLFFVLSATTVLLAILAVIVSTVLYATLLVALGPLGLPALTAPFVITTWLFLCARGPLQRLQQLSPDEPATPEENLRAARQFRTGKR